jgi:hypothetical protein
MSAPDERTDAWLRETLRAVPRPKLDPVLADRVLKRAAEREREDERRRHVGARLVLWAYWLAAFAASAWILRQYPLPEWLTAVLWGIALAMVPAGYAFALWSRPDALARRERNGTEAL